VAVRVIPRLDIKGPNLVKGIHLEGLRVLGRPEIFARTYYETGADELLFMDAVASLYGRNSLLDVVERTARETFIPLTVGGGLRSLDDIAAVLRAGADKIAINTAVVEHPDLIGTAAERFGSSTIVVHIDAKRSTDGRWIAWTENGREPSRFDAVDWARRAATLGAGEILITSIDREGTGQGYDLELTRAVADAVPIPVIASGGAGAVDHVRAVITDAHADAVCVASILHYDVARRLLEDGFQFEGAGQFKVLAEKRDFGRIQPSDLPALKRHLVAAGVVCRTSGNLETAGAR
jgi:cyclase